MQGRNLFYLEILYASSYIYCKLKCKVESMQFFFLLFVFFLHSSDKNKCYEMIKKLSDIHQSDKEFLKVRCS